MRKFMEIWTKICRKWTRIRLQPIRVFCLHHVCRAFDAESMHECDWMQIDDFESKVLSMLQSGVEFISLTEAYQHLCNDRLRYKKYAVLTFDDGYASLKEVLPWLNGRHIPATLFLNPAYLDGKHHREKAEEHYLLLSEVEHLYEQYPMLTIGTHGWDHTAATELSLEEFSVKLKASIAVLKRLPNFIRFYAFPYGEYSKNCIDVVFEAGCIPLLVCGGRNYSLSQKYIDREVL